MATDLAEMFDRGLLKFGVQAYAKIKGITYEEAHWDCQQWQKENPQPGESEEKLHDATAQDCREWYHHQKRHFAPQHIPGRPVLTVTARIQGEHDRDRDEDRKSEAEKEMAF